MIKLVPFKRYNGTSLRNYLSLVFEKYKISEDYENIIKAKCIHINGNIVFDPNYYLACGDLIEIDHPSLKELTPESFSIIHEDDEICVVNKDHGRHSVDSIYGALWPIEDSLRWLRTDKNNTNPFIAAVHRLDVDTSGILIIAKSKEAASMFGKEIQNRAVEKNYLALVSPPPKEEIFSIDAPIGFDTEKPGFWISYGKKAKDAKTDFSVIKKNNDFALLKCTPKTGRTHQIRVHLKHIASPILGDTIYEGKPFKRLMLHCEKMCFPNLSKLPNSFETKADKSFLEHF